MAERPPGGTTAARRAASLWLLVAASVAPVVVATVAAVSEPWLPTADNAILAMRTLDVPERLPLTGAYSRYGFDHPGPLQFYVLAPFLSLLGPRGMLIGAGAVAALSSGGAVAIGWRRGGLPLAAVVTAVVIVLTHALGDHLVDPWNPLTPVMPFFTLVLLFWSVSCRDWWALPFAMIAASFAAQTHIAYVALAGTLAAAAVVWAAVDRWRARGVADGRDLKTVPNGVVLVTLAVVGAAWMLPLADQLREEGGNLGDMARYFVTGTEVTDDPYFVGTDRPSAGTTIGIVSRQLGFPAPWVGAPEPVDFATGGVSGAPLWRLAVPAALSVAAAAVAWRRRSYDALRLQGITAVLVVIGVVAVGRITGGVYPYLVRWLWVIGALVVLSAVWSLLAGSRLERVLLDARPAGVAVGALVAGAALSSVSLVGTEAPDPDLALATRAVVAPVVELIDDTGAERVEVVPGPLWAPAAISTGLIAELERRGVAVTVPDTPTSRLALRPERTAPPGTADLQLVVVTDAGAVPPGSTVIADHDPLTTTERSELERIAAMVSAFDDLAELPEGLSGRLQELDQRGRGRVLVVEQRP